MQSQPEVWPSIMLKPKRGGRRVTYRPSKGCLARSPSLNAAHERATRFSRSPPQTAFQAAAGIVRRPLPRVRASDEIFLCAEPALHAGGRAEGNAGGATC